AKTFLSVLAELLSKKRKGSREEEEEKEDMSQLYSKGSSSANEMAEIWDDTALIRMYEESISSAYKSVTPAASKNNKKASAQVENEQAGWSVGDRCAAPYEESPGNPLWYPAAITRIDVLSGTVEVCFDGYEGTETVAIDELYPEEELEKAYTDQKEEETSDAENEAMDVSHSFSNSPAAAAASSSSSSSAAAAVTASASRKRANGGGKGGRGREEGRGRDGSTGRAGGGAGFRAPIPSLAPPPPPAFTALPRPSEDDALSSMLMGWYMSGYHTGYYQAMQDLKAAGKK
ncbi:hypothetical protein PMAYCL1PPCAC_25889, partial [Pristionchus mayeri]